MSFPSQNTPKSMSAGASPQTPLGSLQRSPDLLVGFKGATGGEWRGGKGRTRGRGKRGNGEGRRKCGSWGNSALVVGGIDAPAHFPPAIKS